MRSKCLRTVVFLSGAAVAWVAVGQTPLVGPTVQEQLSQLTKLVDTQYERIVREKMLLAPEQPLADPGAKVFRVVEQLRVTTQQCRNREDEAYQLMRFKDGQIAAAQLTQQEQTTLIQGLRAQVESLEKAMRGQSEAQPAGPGPAAPGAERAQP